MNFRALLDPSLVLSALVSFAVLPGCNSDDPADDGAGGAPGSGGASSGTGGQGTGGSPSALESRFRACPELSQSSDPAASTCLVGTYEGETVLGEPCSLEIGADGDYAFTSPDLSVSHDAPDDAIFVYGYTLAGEYHQLVWKVDDPISTDAFYELDFQVRFGTGVPENDRKIEIDVVEHGADSTTSVACIVPL